jgi:hypothetical protein
MTDPLDDRLHAIFRAAIDDDGAALPDPSLIWWRALRQERERQRWRATLPVEACSTLLEGATCIAPAILLCFGVLRGTFEPSPGFIVALAASALLAALWMMTRFFAAPKSRPVNRYARPYVLRA